MLRPLLVLTVLIATAAACGPVSATDPTPHQSEDNLKSKKKRTPTKEQQDEGSADSAEDEDETNPEVGSEGTPMEGEDDEAPAPSPSPSPSPTPTPTKPGPTQLRGSIDRTGTTSFGGGEHCNFRVTLTNVTVDVRTDGNGGANSANVSATAVEEVVSGSNCPKAIPSHRQTWTLSQATDFAGTQRLTLSPGGQNLPPTTLTITGNFKSANAVAMTWKRTDYPAPLDWQIKASTGLSP